MSSTAHSRIGRAAHDEAISEMTSKSRVRQVTEFVCVAALLTMPACAQTGRPENAKLAGLSRSYIFAQVRALHFGERQPGKPGWPPTVLMQNAIADMTDTQILEAAEYFSQQRNASFVQVLERGFAPAHKPGCGIYVPGAGRPVPLKQTIVEMPTDATRFEAREQRGGE